MSPTSTTVARSSAITTIQTDAGSRVPAGRGRPVHQCRLPRRLGYGRPRDQQPRSGGRRLSRGWVTPNPDGTVPRGKVHGFVWDAGRFTSFDVPGSFLRSPSASTTVARSRAGTTTSPEYSMVRAAEWKVHDNHCSTPNRRLRQGQHRLGHQRSRRDRHPRSDHSAAPSGTAMTWHGNTVAARRAPPSPT